MNNINSDGREGNIHNSDDEFDGIDLDSSECEKCRAIGPVTIVKDWDSPDRHVLCHDCASRWNSDEPEFDEDAYYGLDPDDLDVNDRDYTHVADIGGVKLVVNETAVEIMSPRLLKGFVPISENICGSPMGQWVAIRFYVMGLPVEGFAVLRTDAVHEGKVEIARFAGALAIGPVMRVDPYVKFRIEGTRANIIEWGLQTHLLNPLTGGN